MHYRRQIRAAMKALLLAAGTGAGENVFTSRTRPVLEILQKRESVLSIYTSDEASDRNGDGFALERRLTVTIEGALGGGDDADDGLDDLAEQVENAINADPTLGNLLSEQLVLESTVSETGSRGNMTVAAFRMDFVCEYRTALLGENWQPGDDLSEEPEIPPVPTSIEVTPRPTPVAYVAPIGSVTADEALQLGDTDLTLKQAQPEEPIESVCDEDSCAIPAYTGDTTDESMQQPVIADLPIESLTLVPGD